MSLVSRFYNWQYEIRQAWVGAIFRIRTPRPTVAPPVPENPRRVLLVLSGLIGDTVLSTSLIIEARRVWPQARLAVLGRARNCALLHDCPLVDEFIETSVDPFALVRRPDVGALRLRLKDAGFEIAVIALGDQFASLLYEVGIPVRVGVKGHWLQPCLTHTYEIRDGHGWGPNDRLGALRALGYHTQPAPPTLWASRQTSDGAMGRLLEHGLPAGQRFMVFHPFGSSWIKYWPMDRVKEVADRIWEQKGLYCVIVGGPETVGRVEPGLGASIVDSTGRLSLQELTGVIADAELVVSSDSGPFHMAGALGVPLVGMFRTQAPEHAGYYPQARTIFGSHPDCAGHCEWNRCDWQPCRQMLSLDSQTVLDAIAALGRQPAGQEKEGLQYA